MRKWMPLVPILLSTFMLLLDVTIVSVAIPSMATALDTSFAALQWTMDLYVLVLASFLLAAGSASDRFGRRYLFLLGLVIFTVASLAAGLAPSSGVLIAARGVQGLGAAAMLATNAALIHANYQGRDRGTAFGVWGGVMGAAAAAGPIVGGLLIDYVNWRAIFLVNLPLAIFAIALAVRTLPESRSPVRSPLDLPGTVTFTAAVTLLVYGLIEAGEEGWGDTVTVAAFGAAAVLLIAFIVFELRSRAPMLDLALFRRPSFTTLMVGGAVLQGAAFGYVISLSLWAQSLLGMSAIKAGLILTPLSGAAFVVAVLVGRLLHDAPPQYLIGNGLLLIGDGVLLATALGADSGWIVLMPALLLAGIGVGLASPILASATLAAVPPARSGMANGAINTFRQLGFALAVPAAATILAGGARSVLDAGRLFENPDEASVQLTGGRAQELIAATPAPQDAVVRTLHDAFATGLDRVFVASGVAALVAGVAVLAFVRPSTAPAPAPPKSAPEPPGDQFGGLSAATALSRR
ncbi:MAG: MFS transporter [Actinobacteria bacterium]|nr:MFS transporter [Actinomycetota bacterium]